LGFYPAIYPKLLIMFMLEIENMSVLIVIPCYNEGKYIRDVLVRIKKQASDILVVDDGSTDNSLKEIRRVRGVNVISNATNKGKGASLKAAFSYALQKGYDAVITIDADGQHLPEEIKKFLKNYGRGDIIVGSRMHNPKGMPIPRRIGNHISSMIMSLMCHQRVYDCQSGYRLINSKVLRDIRLGYNNFMLETEILLKSARKGYKIVNIPIKTIYTDKVSHINPIRLFYDFVKFVFRNDHSR
jgi:glycosyltransferase involved in cell wall biosynthesis